MAIRILLLVLIAFNSTPIRAENSPEGVVKGTGGVLIGTPVGFFTGLTRGAANEAMSFTDGIQRGFGEETTLSKIISYPVGIVSGGIIGGASGAIKGVINGIYHGAKNPFSDKSFSVDGDFKDFDAFDYSLQEDLNNYRSGYSEQRIETNPYNYNSL